MVGAIAEACREARIIAEHIPISEFAAIYYYIENQHIGTGSLRVATGPEHCLFRFVQAPSDPWLHANVAGLAFFFDINNDTNADLMRVKHLVMVHCTGGPVAITAEQIKDILDNVEYLSCRCEYDSSTEAESSSWSELSSSSVPASSSD